MVCVAVVAAAPLFAGGVHRATLMLLMGTCTVGYFVYFLGTRAERRDIRLTRAVLWPVAFLLVPAVQSIPLPIALRHALDPNGTELLINNAISLPGWWPLSLDPSSTRAEIGKAALALAAFVVAAQLVAGQSRRYLFTRAVAATGLTAFVIGIGHRVLGIEQIYGLLNSTHRTLITGPFVNANHTAELLELAAFACLACSFQRPTALNRVGWLIGTALCAGGVVSTLSRGGVVALSFGAIVFAIWRGFAPQKTERGRGRSIALWGGGLVIVAIVALALGGETLVERFRIEGSGAPFRTRLWRDGLHVLAAHPMGIGRGAFDRVFPIYRTLDTPLPVRFAFVENEWLQILIDAGWALGALTGIAGLLLGWQLVRRARFDRVEAALLGGLAAVLAHNVFDFGLETPGVLLPFAAILGTVVGRARSDESRPRFRAGAVSVGVVIGLIGGMVSLAHGSSVDFDHLLKRTSSNPAAHELLVRAQRVHPLDYYYALAFARLEPLSLGPTDPSPRLHALNRALALCPRCEAVHAEVARSLWRLGMRSQALLEWRTTVEIQPRRFKPLLSELFAAGATPEELASVASPDPQRMIDAAQFLGSAGQSAAAMTVLAQTEALGSPSGALLFAKAKLQLDSGASQAGQQTIAQLRALGVHDPRLPLLEAQSRIALSGAAAVDDALALLQGAAASDPFNVDIQEMRLRLVMQFAKWTIAERVLDDYKQALYHANGSATDAHVASARVYSRLSRWNDALAEYRIALAERSGDAGLWVEYGRAAESAGRIATARDAYAAAARLSPANRDIVEALKSIEEKSARLRSGGPFPPP